MLESVIERVYTRIFAIVVSIVEVFLRDFWYVYVVFCVCDRL